VGLHWVFCFLPPAPMIAAGTGHLASSMTPPANPRVVKQGGLACLIGPVHPTFWLSRFFADVWMLFPTEAEYQEVRLLCLPCCPACALITWLHCGYFP
jgi:hypothetical protein